jgi:hypothetical protein
MEERQVDVADSPLEKLELLARDEEALAEFLEELDTATPRDREMLGELARTQPLAEAARFPAAHRHAVAALETLGRHGYHGSLVAIFKRREIGLPSFVIGAVLIPVFATGWRVTQGVAFRNVWVAVATGIVTVLVVVGGSCVILRGAAMASRRIRLSTRGPLEDLWRTVGSCGRPPKDHSRRFAIVAITLTVGAWVVLPLAVALAFTG